MKTPHRRLQKCTWPTSLPRFNFVWKIVRVGVHDQLWQKSLGKGMWKKQLSAVSYQLSVRAASEAESAHKLAGVMERGCKSRPQMGLLSGCAAADEAVGGTPDEKSFYGVANKRGGCTMVSFSRSKKKFRLGVKQRAILVSGLHSAVAGNREHSV